MKAATTVEDIRRRVRAKSAALVGFMNSEIGKAVISALEEEFYDGELFDPDPYKSAYNLGRRDVVVYLKQLQRQSERD
jgi:hypothetical protein